MGEYVGFDVSKEETAFCVKGLDGTVLRHGTVAKEAIRQNRRPRLRRQPCSRRRKGPRVLDQRTGIRQPNPEI